MDVTFHKMYLYDHVWELLAVGDNLCPCMDNGPMNNNTPLKCHKGIDNKLIFRVLNPDRSPYTLPSCCSVYARIIDPENRMVVLEKLCRIGPAVGLITLELDAGDITDIRPGIFQVVLIRTEQFIAGVNDYLMEKPLYTDLNDDVAMQLEITEQAFKAPLPSVVIRPENWTKDILVPTMGPPAPCFYTSRIPGARVLNHKESVHTFSVYARNLTGFLEIWGSLEETPDAYLSATRWFKIYPSTLSEDIQFRQYTGTQAWTFSANFMWLKFRFFPSLAVRDPGVLEKLIVRT
jgi:hypothetical protein